MCWYVYRLPILTVILCLCRYGRQVGYFWLFYVISDQIPTKRWQTSENGEVKHHLMGTRRVSCIYVYIYIYIYTTILYIYIQIIIYIYTYIIIYAYIQNKFMITIYYIIQNLPLQQSTDRYVHTWYMCIRMCIYMYTYTHVHMYTS